MNRLSLGSDGGKDYGILQAIPREKPSRFFESVWKYFGSRDLQERLCMAPQTSRMEQNLRHVAVGPSICLALLTSLVIRLADDSVSHTQSPEQLS